MSCEFILSVVKSLENNIFMLIFIIRLTGCSPFLGDNDQETIQNVVAGEFDFPEEEEEGGSVSEDAQDFITKLLRLSPRWVYVTSTRVCTCMHECGGVGS